MRHHDEPARPAEPGDVAVGRPGPLAEGHRAGARPGHDRAAQPSPLDGVPGRRPGEDLEDRVRVAAGQVDEIGRGEALDEVRIGGGGGIDDPGVVDVDRRQVGAGLGGDSLERRRSHRERHVGPVPGDGRRQQLDADGLGGGVAARLRRRPRRGRGAS